MAEQKSRLKRPVSVVRAELLADPDTKKIAKAVNMKLEEYVELVLDYAQNPDKEPQLQVASDEDLKKADPDYNPPKPEEVAQFFLDAASGKIPLEGGPDFNKSGFESAPASSGKPSLQGDVGQKPATASDKNKGGH